MSNKEEEIKEEIKEEGLVRKLDAFIRFLESASFSQGAVLNISNIAKLSIYFFQRPWRYHEI